MESLSKSTPEVETENLNDSPSSYIEIHDYTNLEDFKYYLHCIFQKKGISQKIGFAKLFNETLDLWENTLKNDLQNYGKIEITNLLNILNELEEESEKLPVCSMHNLLQGFSRNFKDILSISN
ncbi:MAG TPA: hypothetical protein PLQ36_00910 [Candidatus Gracilibacteria bacterium]|nr:hypothetical protein [Candidatus Gracilibacteria bacterium]